VFCSQDFKFGALQKFENIRETTKPKLKPVVDIMTAF